MHKQMVFNYFKAFALLIFMMLDKSKGSPVRIIPKTRVDHKQTLPEEVYRKTYLNQQNVDIFHLITTPRRTKNLERLRLKSTISPNAFQNLGFRHFDEEHPTVRSQEKNSDSDKLLRRVGLRARAHHNYYPDPEKLSTVCYGKSTIYNRPRVFDWLRTQINSNWGTWIYANFKHRVLFTELRKSLFNQGRSEECHTRELATSQKYLDCALKRHQRMEYLIPQYPLHQQYYHKFTTHIEKEIYH